MREYTTFRENVYVRAFDRAGRQTETDRDKDR